jgi:hypothetical protein
MHNNLVEETNDLASHVLSPGLLVVHDTGGGGEHDVTELTGWEELDNPLLKVGDADVVAWGDNTSLVQAAVELDNNLAGSVVVNLFELSDVSYRHLLVSRSIKRCTSRVSLRTCKIGRSRYIENLKGKGREVVLKLRPLPSYHLEDRRARESRQKSWR